MDDQIPNQASVSASERLCPVPVISLFVIFLWIFLDQKPGMGTILNAVIIAFMIDLSINFVGTPNNYFFYSTL